jgi:hypothetical protein
MNYGLFGDLALASPENQLVSSPDDNASLMPPQDTSGVNPQTGMATNWANPDSALAAVAGGIAHYGGAMLSDVLGQGGRLPGDAPAPAAPIVDPQHEISFKGTFGNTGAGQTVAQAEQPLQLGGGGGAEVAKLGQSLKFGQTAADLTEQSSVAKSAEDVQAYKTAQEAQDAIDEKYGVRSEDDRKQVIQSLNDQDALYKQFLAHMPQQPVAPSVFEKVMGVMSHMPGIFGFAAGMAGNISQTIRGDDPASLERQAQFQKQVQEQYKMALDLKAKRFDQWKALGIDDLSAHNAANTEAKDNLTRATQGIIAKYQSPEALAKWNDENSKLLETNAKDNAEVKAQAATTYKTQIEAAKLKIDMGNQQVLRAAAAKALAGVPLTPEEDRLMRTDPEYGKHYVPALGQISTEAGASAANQFLQKDDAIQKAIADAIQFRNKVGATGWHTEAARQGQVIGTNLMTQLMADEDFKRLSPESQKIFSTMAPQDVGSWGRVGAGLRELQTLKQNNRAATLKALGFRVPQAPTMKPLPPP